MLQVLASAFYEWVKQKDGTKQVRRLGGVQGLLEGKDNAAGFVCRQVPNSPFRCSHTNALHGPCCLLLSCLFSSCHSAQSATDCMPLSPCRSPTTFTWRLWGLTPQTAAAQAAAAAPAARSSRSSRGRRRAESQ